jgi:hypothetical protein
VADGDGGRLIAPLRLCFSGRVAFRKPRDGWHGALGGSPIKLALAEPDTEGADAAFLKAMRIARKQKRLP